MYRNKMENWAKTQVADIVQVPPRWDTVYTWRLMSLPVVGFVSTSPMQVTGPRAQKGPYLVYCYVVLNFLIK